MPVTQSAAKALRRDQRRRLVNQRVKARLKKALDLARQDKNPTALNLGYRTIDLAAKKKIIHPNKAAHLKSQLARLKLS